MTEHENPDRISRAETTDPATNVENLGLWTQVERVQQSLGREIPAEVELIDTP